METISPQASPTGSLSPPVTPFSIALPHTYALPPLKTLPTWNRNKFKDDKTRSIPKNKNIKVELIGQIGKIENCTQTTPTSISKDKERLISLEKVSSSSLERVSSSLQKVSSSARGSAHRKNENNLNKLKKTYDKKIVFLETNHQDVLSNLHQELEKMKSQNRDLKFQLVMAGEDTSRMQDENDEKRHTQLPNNIMNNTEETKVLKGEIRELKKLLSEADSKNVHLTKLIDQLRQRSSTLRLTSGTHDKSKVVSSHDIHSSHQSNLSVKVNQEEGELRTKEKEKPSEIPLSDEKDDKQQNKENMMFPRLDQCINRSAPITSTTVFRRTHETISLPLLQGLPGNRNMSLRQKRARALHVRRQRSNKNVTLLAAAAAMTTNR